MHTCKVYFNVGLPFDEQKFRALIAKKVLPADIAPTQIDLRYADEVAAEFKKLGCTVKRGLRWLEINTCTEYSPVVDEMTAHTLHNLIGNEDKLVALKQKYNLTYTLEIIPKIDHASNQSNPCLSPADEVIAFLYKSQTSLDIDYYVL